MGPDAMIFVFWMLSFKPTFSLSYFTFIKRLFSSSSLSAIRVVSSVQSCPTLCDPMACSTPGSPVLLYLPEDAQTHVDLVMLSNHLILCPPLLLLPSVFPSIRIFSNESALRIRWTKYWTFSFSISPSDEYSGLISFRIDWFDLLAFQGTLKHLLQHHSSTPSILRHSDFFIVQLLHPTMTEKP